MAELQEAIQLLEEEKAFKLQLMKENFHQTYESIEPAKLIQNTLKEISTTPFLIDNLLSAGVGLAVGYVSRKVVLGRSHNSFRRLLGTVLQFGITNIVAKNPSAMKSFARAFSRRTVQIEK
jgi:hypothetical protein